MKKESLMNLAGVVLLYLMILLSILIVGCNNMQVESNDNTNISISR